MGHMGQILQHEKKLGLQVWCMRADGEHSMTKKVIEKHEEHIDKNSTKTQTKTKQLRGIGQNDRSFRTLLF